MYVVKDYLFVLAQALSAQRPKLRGHKPLVQLVANVGYGPCWERKVSIVMELTARTIIPCYLGYDFV